MLSSYSRSNFESLENADRQYSHPPTSGRSSLRGTLDLLVLKVLSRGKPLSGYAIQQAIEMESKGVLHVRDSSLYPALDRMDEAGWISADRARNGRRRAWLWQLSDEGKAQLRTEKLRWPEFRFAVDGMKSRIADISQV
jgi:DNA-binding PadR family transcriptional regulator